MSESATTTTEALTNESAASKAENLNTNNNNNNNNNECVNEIKIVEAKEEVMNNNNNSKRKQLFEGHVKWFSKRSGYGFICRDGTTDELFVHLRSLSRSRRWPHRRIIVRTGDKVKFMIRECEKGLEAFNVRLLRPAYLEETVLSIRVPSKSAEIDTNNESPVRSERKVSFMSNRHNTRYMGRSASQTTGGNRSVLKMSEAVLVNMLKYIDSKGLHGGSFDRLKHESPINYKLQKIDIPYREIKNSYRDLFTRGVRVISLVLSNNGKDISAHILTGKEMIQNRQQQTKPVNYSNSTKIERKITKFNLKQQQQQQQTPEAVSK